MTVKHAIAPGMAKTVLTALLALAAILEGGPAWAASSGSPWGANYFPNVELVDQDGRKLRFYDDLLKGKVFALNFIYTRCTAACPTETAALRKVQKELGEQMGRDVYFYSISVDAERDTPEQLKDYAEKFHAGPGWLFLSGSKDDVELIRRKLAMYRADGQKEKTLSEHSVAILMGSEEGGQWIKRSPFEDPKALARILGVRLHTTGATASNLASGGYAVRAPAPVTELPGAKLFHPQCSNCHSLDTAAADDIGPGLAGITQKRDRNWLKRWIKEPDALIARKDKTALSIYKDYREIPMPNLGLTDEQVEYLIQYLESHDVKVAKSAQEVAKSN